MKTAKRKYMDLADGFESDWLVACVNDPSVYMTKMHCLIIRCVLRRRGIQL